MDTSKGMIVALFRKFHAIYLRRWLDMIGEAPIEVVMAEWEAEIGVFTRGQVAYALQGLKGRYKEWPPTLYQFRDLCVEARAIERSNQAKLLPPRQRVPQEIIDRMRSVIGKMNATTMVK